MARPGGGGDELAIRVCIREGLVGIDPFGSGAEDVRLDRGVGHAGLALEDVGGHEDLLAVTDRSDRFVLQGEMAHDFDDTVVQSQVFGRPAARDDQRVDLREATMRSVRNPGTVTLARDLKPPES